MRNQPRKRALLILDMVSEFRFPGWQPVLRAAQRVAPRIAALKQRAQKQRCPVIYINDTAGTWEADQTRFMQRCLAPAARGREVARQIAPQARDCFVFKPRHSAFYSTPLSEILAQLGIDDLILTGITSHQCVLFTAMDAYVRDYGIFVPADCIGAGTANQTRHALVILQEGLKANITSSAHLRLRSRK